MKKSKVRILVQDYLAIEASNKMPLQAAWDLQRKLVREYESEKEGIEVADEAFHIFNVPEENLSAENKEILKDYRGPSLSVGDIVEVHPLKHSESTSGTAYLCDSIGWKQKEIPNINVGQPTTNNQHPPTVDFLGEACTLRVELYNSTKTPALQLLTKDGSPMGTATVNLPELKVKDGHILVKNYSENSLDGKNNMVKALESAKIAEPVEYYKVGPFDSEVVLMKIKSPWVLKAIQTQQSKISQEKQKLEDQSPEMM
jgi:hypothetical protein